MTQPRLQQPGFGHRLQQRRDRQRQRCAHAATQWACHRHQQQRQPGLHRQPDDRPHQIGITRHIDQSAFRHRRLRREQFHRQQHGQHRHAGGKGRAKQAHRSLSGNTQRQHRSELHSCHPETDLAHMPGRLGQIAGSKVASEHRAQNGIEAGFQPLRQRGDLLRHIIDADDLRRGKTAKDEDVQPARAPFGDIGAGQWHIGFHQSPDTIHIQPPTARPAKAAQRRRQCREKRRHHRQQISDQHAVAFQGGERQRQRSNRQYPGFNDRTGPHLRANIMVESQPGQRHIGQRNERDNQCEPPIKRRQPCGRKHQFGQQHQHRCPGQRRDQRRQQRITQSGCFILRAARHVFGKAALEAERGQHRHQFHHHGGIGKAAERFGAIEPAGNEQERKARRQPQHITEEAGATALGQGSRFGRVPVWVRGRRISQHAPGDSGRADRAKARGPDRAPAASPGRR